MNNKPCKLCDKVRFANTSWCYRHYKQREKEKREEKARLKKERHEATKTFSESLRKRLHRKAWKLMSQYIRRRDANLDGYLECYTCGKIDHYKKMDAGHFKHDRLDFDERNLKPQCDTCNRRYSGRLDVYAEKLIRENGLEWFNKLVQDAWAHQGYSSEELAIIILDLKTKVANLD